jgi:hypothetical protein
MRIEQRGSAHVAAPHPLPVNTGRGKIHCYFMGLTPKTKSGGNALSPSPCGERAEIGTARKPWRSRVRGSRWLCIVAKCDSAAIKGGGNGKGRHHVA